MLALDVVRAYLGEIEKTTYFHLNLNKGPRKMIYPVLIPCAETRRYTRSLKAVPERVAFA